MRASKVFGVKSITNLIYGLLMIAPFVAILSRVIYTQANANAKDSYSNQLVEKTINITNSNRETLYIQNQTIQIVFTNKTYTSRSGKFGFNNINIDLNELLNTNDVVYKSFEFYTGTSTFMYFYDANETQYRLDNYKTILNGFTYIVDLSTYTTYSIYNFVNAYTFTYVNQPLDNAFEYSLSEFTKDNDIGVINFFGWFEGYFLDQSNVHNLVYLNFANWYMNYALLVSSSYLLFLALILFVNYIRRILDKSMNQEYGGF